MKRDIPGHILGFFFFLVTIYYAFAFYLSFSKSGSEIRFDLDKGSGFALIYMISYVWMPAVAGTIAYYALLRASLLATVSLGVIAVLLLFLVVKTDLFDGGSLRTVLFVWTGVVAAFVHHATVMIMRLFVRADSLL